MTPKRWFFLLLFYISYLFFGASIYYHIENKLEKEERLQELRDRIAINEYLIDELQGKSKEVQDQVLTKISNYCDKPVTNYTLEELDNYVPYRWTFYHAFFFAFTVCSTVGYGNISPTTTLGRMLLIPYSLLGMPVNGILFAGVGEYFSTTFTGIYTRYKKYRINNDTRYVPRQFGLIATIAIALLPGIAFFIILPSCLFTYFEDWPFSLSVYYSYVTTTTIGFGDYVPTFAPTQPREFGGWFVFYQIFIIFWFIFSLGYLLMIITFITKALKSKKLRKMEQQLRTNIRQTQNKIWHGVSKDVGYLRRILNELYIMKFKPVYNEEGESDLHLPRSISCPDLTIYRTDSPIVSRKRAFSECYDMDDSRAFRVDGTPMIKGSSDTDLSRINKQKTFETAEAFKHTTDLLAKVVTALASIETPQEPTVGMTGYYGDVQGFSDSQILASENSFNPADIPHRSRAMSDFYINPNTRSPSGPNEWTWSGDNSRIQQAINDRFKTAKPTRTVSMGDDPYTINMPFDENAGKKKKFSIADGKNFIKNWLPFKRRDSQDAFAQKDRKMSILSAPPETPIDEFPSLTSSYSTIPVSQGMSGKSIQAVNSNLSLFSNNMPPAKARRSSLFPMFPGLCSERPSQEQRTVGANERPLFKPSPAGPRRNSMFTQNQRRGSLFSPVLDRKKSMFSASNEMSLRSDRPNRRPSLFSVPSQEEINQDVLENTTIADLIRALEVMHTQAALSEPPPNRQRRGSKAPPNIPIASLFALDNDGPMPSSRAYGRRSTIMGTLTPSTTSSIPSRSRRMSAISSVPEGPPPIYTEKETFTPKESTFRRRFSVRPTNLSTPIGKAPPPQTPSVQPSTSQSALGRKPLYRPSPLARDPNVSTDPSASSASPRSGNTITSIPARLGTSSSHSPLARIAQISQAAKSGNLPGTDGSQSTDPNKRKD